MAESIYTILGNGTTLTAVKGEGEHNMTLHNMPTAEQFSNAEMLKAWAIDNNCLHACLQKGVQKHLIDMRSQFRFVKKDQAWNITQAQKNVDSYEWAVMEPPKEKSNEVDKQLAVFKAGVDMARAMISAGLKEKTIMAALTPVYGPEVAGQIWEALEES